MQQSRHSLAIRMKAVLLLVVLVTCISSLRGLSLTVNTRGSDDPSCVNGSIPCRTLHYLAAQLVESGTNSNISIATRGIVPGTISRFVGITNLSLTGPRFYIRNCGLSNESGIVFLNVTNLHIRNMQVRACGIRGERHHSIVFEIRNCKNVVVQDSQFRRCRETAILFADTYGDVSLTNVEFSHNSRFDPQNQIYSHSGGIEMVFSRSKNGSESTYLLSNCTFSNNTAPTSYQSYVTNLRQGSEWRGHSAGGGLGIYFQGNSSWITVYLHNCTFKYNFARFGAGMHVMFQDEAMHNQVQVVNTTFMSNRGRAGGGVCVRHFKTESLQGCQERCNQVSFQRVLFSSNMVEDFGGGTSLLSVYSAFPLSFKVYFFYCTWYDNLADHGSAIDVAPALFQRLDSGHLPSPEFIGSNFSRNSVNSYNNRGEFPFYYFQYSGIFVVTKSKVYFSGNTQFRDNLDSALYMNSGIAVFNKDSSVVFENNQASRGAAIACFGYTAIVLGKNSFIRFSQNYAREIGAAIYYRTYDQHDFKSGRECFLKVNEDGENIADLGISNSSSDSETVYTNTTNNITMLFDGNRAAIAGSSMYVSTLYPCFFSSNHQLVSTGITSDIFDFIDNVQFDNEERFLATDGREFDLSDVKKLYELIPGKLVHIPLYPVDEFENNNTNRDALLITFERDNIKADRQYMVEGRVRFYGAPESSDILKIIQVAPRKVVLNIALVMLSCPPGFYYDAEDSECKCSIYSNLDSKSYRGILKCDVEKFHAFLIQGFWIGYIPSTKHYPENLHTAICPLNFCRLHSSSNQLPSNSSELSESVCARNRRGILCGECKEGFSSFFHSEGFECGSNRLCSIGIVLYTVSELLPIVVLFTMVIVFDFSFTAGNINGLIFFSQILESLSVDSQMYDQHHSRFLAVTRLFYGIFNLDYFSISSLSFCLWKNATVIDVLAFKFISMIFAFALVLFLIFIMKHIKCSKIEKRLGIKERVSVINGLSAFLIMCYSQCTRTSFYILTPVQLRGQGGVLGDTLTLFGGFPYFEGRHLFYSIVAILFIVTIVLIPPIVLILYPLLLHLLAYCKLSEHFIVLKTLKALQIYRCKPLIDSFQGCYKDKLRFFAGLYFIYRVIILAGFSVTRTTSQFYVISQFLLLMFLGIHAIAQPYKQRRHNIINSLIFLNLVLINACSIFIDVYSVESRENQFIGFPQIVLLFLSIQTVLVYLPMVLFLIWTVKIFILFALRFCKNRFRSSSDPVNGNAVDDAALFNTLEYHRLEPNKDQEIPDDSETQEAPEGDDPEEDDEADVADNKLKVIINKASV